MAIITPAIRVGPKLLQTIKDNFATFSYKASSNPKPTIGLNPIPDEKIASAVDLFNEGKTQEFVRKAIDIPNNHARVIYRSLKETNDEISTILRGETGKTGTTLTPSQIQYFLKNTATIERPGISYNAIADELGINRYPITRLAKKIENNPDIRENLNKAILEGKVPGVTEPLAIKSYKGPAKARLIAGKNPATKSRTNSAQRRAGEKAYLADPNVPQSEKDLFKEAYEVMTANNFVFKDMPGYKINVDHVRALRFFTDVRKGINAGNIQLMDEYFNKAIKGEVLEKAKGSIMSAATKFRNSNGFTEAKKHVKTIVDEFKKIRKNCSSKRLLVRYKDFKNLFG